MKTVLVILALTCICASCAPCDEDYLHTVPRTNNPHYLPKAGKSRIPGMGSVK